MVRAIEAKDLYIRGHSESVTRYALAIASKLGLSEKEIEILRTAALLHDIGKIGISEEISNKPSSLTEEEYKEVKNHPQLATQIIGSIPLLKEVIPIIFYHHEKYDGTGYLPPNCLCLS
ncbi:MAG: HD domain-containing protein [Actinomycetota bacterium]|nr:HD domain-containing protein [Actinomycetota bacterium]